jgi:hypothetical protein
MDLTPSLVRSKAGEYREAQPLAAVEADHLDILPEMLASGEFGWRDVEWVPQWYVRRDLGAYPDRERRDTEAAFDENTYEEVRGALAAVDDADELRARIDPLRSLAGVDTEIASAFLSFMDPDRYVVIGQREWAVLQEAGELDNPYPDPPSPADYLTYHETCETLCDRLDIAAWTLYRALWQLGREGNAETARGE